MTGFSFAQSPSLSIHLLQENCTVGGTGARSGNRPFYPTLRLSWENAPLGTKSFVLIVDDPKGAPETPPATKTAWVHLNLFNIPSSPTEISTITASSYVADFSSVGGTLGKNDWDSAAWGGPCPSARTGAHSHHFAIYAMSSVITPPNPLVPLTRSEFETTYGADMLGVVKIVGQFEHPTQ